MISKFNYPSLIIAIFILYFLYLDFKLYREIQNESHQNIKITVKAVMLDHVNSYILQPLSEQLVEWTNFPSVFPSISANHISYLGVVAALIASRLIFMDMRRTAVFMFIIRQFLDDLDGLVARFHLGIDTKKQVSLPNSSGYIVDGICDGFGLLVFWFSVFRCNYTIKSNVLQSNTTYKLLNSSKCVSYFNLFKSSTIVKHYILLMVQIGLSSVFWNIFLIQYHKTLDPSVVEGFQSRTPLQEEIFKSSLMYTIMWVWRCLNPHALTNYFLLSVWYNQSTQYAKRSNQYLFWSILGISFLCVIHLKDVKYRIDMEQYSLS